MRTLITYPLPTGARALVLVAVEHAKHPFVLLDTPAEGPLRPDAECFVVEDRLDDEEVAYNVAVLHMHRSERAGRPAEPFAA